MKPDIKLSLYYAKMKDLNEAEECKLTRQWVIFIFECLIVIIMQTRGVRILHFSDPNPIRARKSRSVSDPIRARNLRSVSDPIREKIGSVKFFVANILWEITT